jgi:protein TonB
MSKLISITSGVAFTFVLFVAMTYLIEPEERNLDDNNEPPMVAFLYQEVDDEPKPIIRVTPELKHEPKPKRIQTISEKPNNENKLAKFTRMKFEPDMLKVATVVGTDLQGNSDGDAIAKVQITPAYPRDAATKGIEGYVTLQFDVTAVGTTENISVVEAKPRGVFEKAAKRALKKWRYKPKMDGGKAVAQPNQKMTLEFNLESELL